jgi:DnaJ-class molecular chaperone
MVDVTLEEIFSGGKYYVKVKREIRETDQPEVKIEEERYAVMIEPGCPDGKVFRFDNAGHRDPVNIPADLIVQIRTKPHELYERNDSDLIYKATVPLEDVYIFFSK